MAATKQLQIPSRLSLAAAAIWAACAVGGSGLVGAAERIPNAQAATQGTAGAGRNTVEQRVEKLSKALALSAQQRARLTLILESQRAAVAKIWSDTSLLPAERAPATRAVEQHTADQIRQILNQEQKDRYNPPKPISAQTEPVDVSKWLDLARASNSGSRPSP
jgi:hypothetical protein